MRAPSWQTRGLLHVERRAILGAMRYVWLLLLLVGCPHTQYVQAQRHVLISAMPAELDPGARRPGEPRVARIRVYADAEFRAQNLRWRKRVADELDYVSQLLTPMLGARLDVVEYVEWNHHAPGAPLRDTLAALEQLDAGDDVAFVIAFTGALSLVSTDHHELGMAELLGHHAVIRGFADLEERRAFAQAFPDIDTKEQELVLDARRRHKQAVVILHELAHALGAIHETDPAAIMHPIYSAKEQAFSPRNVELMQLAIDERLKLRDLQDPTALASALRAKLEQDWAGWVAADRNDALEFLRASETPHATHAAALPAVAQQQLQTVQRLVQGGDLARARAELDALIAAYPASAELRAAGCQLALAEAGAKVAAPAAARATCERATELAPDDPSATMLLVGNLVANKDLAGARATLTTYEATLAGLSGQHDLAWHAIAMVRMQLGDVSRAEVAAQKANEPVNSQVRTWAAQTRTRYALPIDGRAWKLTPDDEADYVAAQRGILDLVYASKFTEAGRAAAAADKRWPGAPGLAAARCDLALRQNQREVARGLCTRAVRAYPQASWALYLLGVIQLNDARPAAGIATLEKVITIDPTLTQAWRALAKGLRRAKDRAHLDDLAARYRAAFGAALPE